MTLPKGAMTGTPRWSKVFMWAYIALDVVQGWLYLTVDPVSWRVIFPVFWVVMAVAYYRSWRILQRIERES